MAECSNSRCTWPKPSEHGRCLTCQALFVGTLVRHRYEIKQMIGRGGFGTTYLVYDQDCFNEPRILKELSPKPNNASEEEDDINLTAERLFKREAQVLLTIQHAGIPKLYAYFSDRDYSYLVQDYIPGHTLAEEVDRQKRTIDEQEARTILIELADILEYLHTRIPPIVHRDIKPQNLMRHSSGHLLLIDFGAVCQAATGGTNISQTLIGSPGYAPPEQIFGQPVPQSDLYAAGATVLRLLSGIHPSQLFNNKTQRMEWESRIQVSAGLASILNSLLARDVIKRMPSATELKQQLEHLMVTPVVVALNPLPPAPEPSLTETIRPQETLQFRDETGISKTPFPQSAPEIDLNLLLHPDEKGELAQTPFLFLLRRFYKDRFTGSLVCHQNNINRTIFFDQGTIIFATSSLERERLGEVLLNQGRITSDEFDNATEIMREKGFRFGSALLEMGKLTSEELKLLIIEQVSQIIYSLFNWTEGTYEVHNISLPNEEIKISVSTADIIFEGLRRLKNIELVKTWIGDFQRKLITTRDPLLLYQAVRLDPKEAFIVSRIDCAMSVEEILSMGGLLEDETLKTICGLLAVGILEWVADEQPTIPTPKSIPVANVLATAASTKPVDFDIKAAASFCYEVEQILNTFENANYYSMLNIDRSAKEPEIRAAYGELAKKFHPDRHAQFAQYNLSLRSELEKIFMQISDAYRVLSDTRQREEYDRGLRNTNKTRIPAELKERFANSNNNRPTTLPPVLEPQTSTPRRLSPPTNEFPSPLTANRAPFSASPGKPRPDSESGKNAIVRPGNLFPDNNPPRTNNPQTARSWFLKGQEYYNSGQYSQACRAFQAASSASPQVAEYHIYLARSLALMKGSHHEAEQEFYQAIQLEPKNADYYAELGLFYQKLNLAKQADEMFDKSLELNPEHPIARRARRPKSDPALRNK